jgi:hypothetical protein
MLITDLKTFESAFSENGGVIEQIMIEQTVTEQVAVEGGQAAGAALDKTGEPAKRSPWRSLGGAFDYEHWEDRDRFVELDFLILLARSDEDEPYRPRRAAHLAAA